MQDQMPSQLGYRWPAEWEPHASTWVAWPHNAETWPGRIDQATGEFVRFVELLSEFEPVNVLAGNLETAGIFESARLSFKSSKNVVLHPIPTNDCWIRDYGPTFLSHDSAPPALIDWHFNSWGNKYPPFDKDNAVSKRIAGFRNRNRFTSDLVVEGGAIEGNGHGVVLTTSGCLTNSNRNPLLSRPEIASHLLDALGAERIVWVKGELVGDDTDGHIDQLVRFIDQNRIVYCQETNDRDPNYPSLQVLEKHLKAHFPACQFELVPLPMPPAVAINGQRLPASFANFYIANGVVIVPAFETQSDQRAKDILAELFPDREVVSLPARNIVFGLGAFHCMTQQEPLSNPDGKKQG